MRRELAFFAAIACTGQDRSSSPQKTATKCGPGPEGSLELGTGELSFAPLADGDVLNMVHGEQGGYHLPLAARGCGMGESASFHYTGELMTGEHIVDVTFSQLWAPQDECCAVALDAYGYIFLYGYDLTPEDLPGLEIALSLLVSDGGSEHTAQRTVVIGPP